MNTNPTPPRRSSLHISSTAWWIGLASVVVALMAITALPGPMITGCFHRKGCFPMPEPPLLYGGLVLVLGSFLSTAVGRLPRHWVVGWNVTLAGIATLAIVGVSVAYRVLLAPTAAAPPLSQFEHGVTLVSATSLIFVTLGVVQVTAGFVAAFVVPPAPFTAPGDAAAPDPRPRWMQQMAAVRAAVGDHQSHTLSSSESQLVAELAYALKRSELDVPPHLESVSAQLLDLLSRGESELDIRGAILDLLDPAIALGHRPPVPYR